MNQALCKASIILLIAEISVTVSPQKAIAASSTSVDRAISKQEIFESVQGAKSTAERLADIFRRRPKRGGSQ